MQVLLTNALEFVVLGFAALLVFDLVESLFNKFDEVNAERYIVDTPPVEAIIPPPVKAIAPTTLKIAAIDWVQPVKEEEFEQIDVVGLAKQRFTPILDFSKLDPFELRKICQQQGIKWRNAHGKNKHLSKPEMLAAIAI